MRKLTNNKGTVLHIVEHIILKNYWEYYVTDTYVEEGIKEALVMGFEQEIGDFSLEEIEPHILSRTTDLNILPAEGWKWMD